MNGYHHIRGLLLLLSFLYIGCGSTTLDGLNPSLDTGSAVAACMKFARTPKISLNPSFVKEG